LIRNNSGNKTSRTCIRHGAGSFSSKPDG
jgi:hypothetical protein